MAILLRLQNGRSSSLSEIDAKQYFAGKKVLVIAAHHDDEVYAFEAAYQRRLNKKQAEIINSLLERITALENK